jgi:hypothetical protein
VIEPFPLLLIPYADKNDAGVTKPKFNMHSFYFYRESDQLSTIVLMIWWLLEHAVYTFMNMENEYG